MTPSQKNPDITIRGGLINVPASTASIALDRHQPNTPVNKKAAKPRPDHQPAPGIPQEGKPDEPTETSQSD